MRDSWRTPPEVFEWASGLVGGFDFDAACTMDNALSYCLWSSGAFTDSDSLSARWPDGAKIWCNPPYSNIDPWIDAALACKSLVAMLILSPNGEARFDRLLKASHEIAITGYVDEKGRDRSGRIAFIDEDGRAVNGNTRGSSLFLINPPYGAGQRSFVTIEQVMRQGADNAK